MAHVYHDHPFGRVPPRRRREVSFRDREEEPIVLPRSSLFRAGGGLLLALTAGAAIVAGSAYAAYHTDAPALLPTPTSPLSRGWQPDPDVTHAKVTNLLSGPALAAPERGAEASAGDAMTGDSPQGESLRSTSAGPSRAQSKSDDSILEDGALAPSFPPVPYPNPTMTPPEGIAPPDSAPQAPTPDSAPQAPTPALDPENPYHDREL